MSLIKIGKEVLTHLNLHGYEAYFVGGMVRDQLLNHPIYDIDITTSALPEQVLALFEKTIHTGLQHGTITVLFKQTPVEITTFRKEAEYIDYRRPTEVFFTNSLREDLQRRDFTMNAIAQDSLGNIYDPYKGMVDISNRLIKAVGNPYDRFEEDPLRILRAIRFISKLNFNLEEQTYNAMIDKAPLITHISKERIKKEIDGVMSGTHSQKGVQYLYNTHLVTYLDDFNALLNYQAYDFTGLTQGLDLFILIGTQCQDLKSFLELWPFSREEKKVIKTVNRLIKDPIALSIMMYRHGEKVLGHYQRLIQFFNQTHEPFMLPILNLTSKKELAINVDTLKKHIKLPNGPWIQQVLEDVENQILLGYLDNTLDEIETYIKTLNIGEENEEKK